MSPRVQAMHVADIPIAFCKLCKLLLRENAGTELPAEFGLWSLPGLTGFTQDIVGCVLGWGCFIFCYQGICFQLGKI